MIVLLYPKIKSLLFSFKKTRGWIFVTLLSLFMWGDYRVFLLIFSYLGRIETIGPLVAERILSLSFFIFLLMLFLSSAITSLTTYFSSREVEFLLSTPLDAGRFFLLRTIENTVYSSWATIVGAFPILVAYLRVFSPSSSPHLAFFYILFFLLLPSCAGISFMLLLKAVIPVKRRRTYITLLGSFVLFYLMLYLITTPAVFRVPYTLNLDALYRYLETLRATNPLFPNTWMVEGIRGLVEGEREKIFLSLALLLSSGLSSMFFLFFLSFCLYRIAWNKEGSSWIPVKKYTLKRETLSPLSSLILKDLKIFIRDPVQWSQVFLILSLLVFYVISLRRTPLYFQNPFWLAVFAAVNTGFVGYITATLSLRFVFPSISLEGKYRWFLLSSPIPRKTLFFSKFIHHATFNSILALIVVFLSNLALAPYPPLILISSFVVLLFAIASVSISLGMGALLPEFDEENAAKIASGGGGLLTAIINLSYIGISVSLFAEPLRLYLHSQIEGVSVPVAKPFLFSFLLFLFISFLFIFLPLYFGIRKIRRMEC